MLRRTLHLGIRLPLVPALLAGLAVSCCHAQQTPPPMVISTDKASGNYQVGDTVHWTVQWKSGTPAPSAHYVLKSGSATDVAHGDLTFSNGAVALDSKMPTPNTLLLEVDWLSEDRPDQTFAGAIAAPDRIRPAAFPIALLQPRVWGRAAGTGSR